MQEIASDMNGYRRSWTRQIRVLQCDKHTEAHYKLARHKNRYCVCRSRTKTQKPATNSLVARSGIADRSIDVIPIGHHVIPSRAMFRNFCYKSLARKTEWVISWGRAFIRDFTEGPYQRDMTVPVSCLVYLMCLIRTIYGLAKV